jgi:hypothetical protein
MLSLFHNVRLHNLIDSGIIWSHYCAVEDVPQKLARLQIRLWTYQETLEIPSLIAHSLHCIFSSSHYKVTQKLISLHLLHNTQCFI